MYEKHDSKGNVIFENKSGFSSRYLYDDFGNCVYEEHSTGQKGIHYYNEIGQRTSSETFDSNGKRINYYYQYENNEVITKKLDVTNFITGGIKQDNIIMNGDKLLSYFCHSGENFQLGYDTQEQWVSVKINHPVREQNEIRWIYNIEGQLVSFKELDLYGNIIIQHEL